MTLAIGIIAVMLMLTGCHRAVSSRTATTNYSSRCEYDPNSWIWNMSFEKFMCIMNDLAEQGKRGSVRAIHDLWLWNKYTHASYAVAASEAILRVYEHLGHRVFVERMKPLADQPRVEHFLAESHAIAEERPRDMGSFPDRIDARQCRYDPNSWMWNMDFEKYLCIARDLAERGKRGSPRAMRDLCEWQEHTHDEGDVGATSYEIYRVYEQLGHAAFMRLIAPLELHTQIALCTTVLDEADADQAMAGRFRAELNVTAEQMPFYPDREHWSGRVVVLLDRGTDASLRAGPPPHDGLAYYAKQIEWDFLVRIDILVDNWYDAEPAAIRARLAAEYARGVDGDDLPLVGAILVGPIPAAQMGKPVRPNAVSPRPLYYEDFDAEWFDDDGDGRFDRCETDRATNATEIWTAWWVPPSNDPDEQAAMLKAFIAKLNRYHRGETGSGDAAGDSSGQDRDVLPSSSRGGGGRPRSGLDDGSTRGSALAGRGLDDGALAGRAVTHGAQNAARGETIDTGGRSRASAGQVDAAAGLPSAKGDGTNELVDSWKVLMHGALRSAGQDVTVYGRFGSGKSVIRPRLPPRARRVARADVRPAITPTPGRISCSESVNAAASNAGPLLATELRAPTSSWA